MKARAVSSEIKSKRLRARYLIVVKGYTQKEAANLVDISEKTMCKWVARFKWKEATPDTAFMKDGFAALMDGFIDYVKQKQPSISKEVTGLWQGYLKSLGQSFQSTG